MASEYAGISVPEGSPGELESLGGQLAGMAGSLEGASMRLRGLPASMQSWSGPASVNFAQAAYHQADAAHAAAVAFTTARDAVLAYASDLREAKREAREAIREARDAKDRIREARAAIAEASKRKAAAEARVVQASISATTAIVTGGDAGSALADQASAQQAVDEAAGDLKRAKTKLQHAEDDLERAQRRGQRAEQDAMAAETRVVAIYGAIGSSIPGVAMPGAPASGVGGGGGRPMIPGADRSIPDPLTPTPLLGGPQTNTPLVPIDQLAGDDGQNAKNANFGLNVVAGMLSGAGAHRAIQNFERYAARATTYAPYAAVARTPDELIALSQMRANAGRAAQASRASAFSVASNFKGAAGALTVAGVPLTAIANHGQGMSTAENVVRTTTTTGGAAIGGTIVGGACAVSGVGTLFTGGCAVVGGIAGGWVGDKGGQAIVYVADHADDAWNATGGALIDAVKK